MCPPDLLPPDEDLVALIRSRLQQQRPVATAGGGASARAAAAGGQVDEDAERVRQAALDAFFGRTPDA